MSIPDSEVSRPWQPVTASGVAAFAIAPGARLAVVAAVIAALSLLNALWIVSRVYVPALESAIRQFPEGGHLTNGRLDWRGGPTQVLHRDTFVEIVVHIADGKLASQTADVQFEIQSRKLNISSLFGVLEIYFQPQWNFPADRPGLQSWWEAWRFPALATLSVAFFIALVMTWLALATVYCLPAFFLAVIGDRKVTLSGCWKLSLAALLPGALFLSAGLFLYSIHQLNLTGLLIVFGLHFMVGWTYLFLGVRQLPPRFALTSMLSENPFRNPDDDEDRNHVGPKNPFDE